MYKLTIRGHPKSKAKLLCRRTKHFIVGRDYEVYFVVKNIGEETLPNVVITINIQWPEHTAQSQRPFKVESLEPGKCYKSETWTFQALSSGLATIQAVSSLSKIVIYKEDGKHRLSSTEAFETFYATTPEAIYEYYAFIVAAISLVSLFFIEIYKIFFKR